ncbi:MAG TPA: hypothetical protein VKQ36_09025 [Ktedonobacterales bacterium]|nr:hypothetical protein [Ktedonobacterales bacterium]
MIQWYSWLVFFHVAGVFVFLGAHGVTAFVIFRVRAEQDLAALRALLLLSAVASMASLFALAVLLIGGIAAAFVGGWWAFGWPWVALGVLVVVWGVMSAWPGREMRRLREAAGFTGPTQITAAAKPEAVASAQMAVHPWIGAVVGGVGLLIILWLMVFKPF